MKSLSALDQGDLLLHTLRIFRQHPAVLEEYRDQYRHILVDEFQGEQYHCHLMFSYALVDVEL